MSFQTGLSILLATTMTIFSVYTIVGELQHDRQIHPASCDVTILAQRANRCHEVYDCHHRSLPDCSLLLTPCVEYENDATFTNFGNYQCCESTSYESRFCKVQIGSCHEYDLSTTFLDQTLNVTHACSVFNPKCMKTGVVECWWDAHDRQLFWQRPRISINYILIAMTGILFLALQI